MNRALIAFYSKPSLVVYNSSQFYFLIWLSSIRLKITFLNMYFIIFVSACVNVGHLSTCAEAKQGHWISWSWTCRWLIATRYRGWALHSDIFGRVASSLNCWSISPDPWIGFAWSYEWSLGPRYVSFFPHWESTVCLISQLSLHNQVQIGYHGWTFLTVSETVCVAAASSLHCVVYCK